MIIGASVLSVLCKVSSKYQGTLVVTNKGVEVTLFSERPKFAVMERMFNENLPKDEARRDKVVALRIEEMILNLDDAIEQSFQKK